MNAAYVQLLRKWMSPVLIGLAVAATQGCLSSGGGGSSRPAPVPAVEAEYLSNEVGLGQGSAEASEPSMALPAPVKPAAPAYPTREKDPLQDAFSDSLRPLPETRIALVGVNVAGAEFTGGTLPGIAGTHYFFPPTHYFAKWRDRGVRSIRFPIKWERLQQSQYAELDPLYAGLIDTMLQQANHYGMEVLLDVHNYGRYYGGVVGRDVPIAAYRDLTRRIAQRWRNSPGLYGYDIMNEPYGSANQFWPDAAQAGIDGVRSYDTARPIFIEGAHYASAVHWPSYSDALRTLQDPYDNLIFSAHLYLDPDTSGSYKEGPSDTFDTMIGVRRLRPFVEWLQLHGKRGHIGEFGVPGDDPRWLEAMDNVLAYLQANCIPMHYWAAGTHWAGYRLSIEPNSDGSDKPQWAVLSKYVGQGDCTAYGPTPHK